MWRCQGSHTGKLLLIYIQTIILRRVMALWGRCGHGTGNMLVLVGNQQEIVNREQNTNLLTVRIVEGPN